MGRVKKIDSVLGSVAFKKYEFCKTEEERTALINLLLEDEKLNTVNDFVDSYSEVFQEYMGKQAYTTFRKKMVKRICEIFTTIVGEGRVR